VLWNSLRVRPSNLPGRRRNRHTARSPASCEGETVLRRGPAARLELRTVAVTLDGLDELILVKDTRRAVAFDGNVEFIVGKGEPVTVEHGLAGNVHIDLYERAIHCEDFEQVERPIKPIVTADV